MILGKDITIWSINLNAGSAVDITFEGGINNVKGNIGLAEVVGDINIASGVTNFSYSVVAKNLILGDSTINYYLWAILIANAINPVMANDRTVKFNNDSAITINSSLGNNNKLNNLEISNQNVDIYGSVAVNNINFTGKDPTTLTLKELMILTL